jgi:hypothetical protein
MIELLFPAGDRYMLNLTQRLILGCVLMVGLIAVLVAVTHKALATAGQFQLA